MSTSTKVKSSNGLSESQWQNAKSAVARRFINVVGILLTSRSLEVQSLKSREDGQDMIDDWFEEFWKDIRELDSILFLIGTTGYRNDPTLRTQIGARLTELNVRSEERFQRHG